MKKMRLDMDALVVESFRTGGDAAGGGTVHGHGTQQQLCKQFPSDSMNALGCDPYATDENTNCAYFTCATCGGAATCGAYTCQGEMSCASCYGMNGCNPSGVGACSQEFTCAQDPYC